MRCEPWRPWGRGGGPGDGGRETTLGADLFPPARRSSPPRTCAVGGRSDEPFLGEPEPAPPSDAVASTWITLVARPSMAPWLNVPQKHVEYPSCVLYMSRVLILKETSLSHTHNPDRRLSQAGGWTVDSAVGPSNEPRWGDRSVGEGVVDNRAYGVSRSLFLPRRGGAVSREAGSVTTTPP